MSFAEALKNVMNKNKHGKKVPGKKKPKFEKAR